MRDIDVVGQPMSLLAFASFDAADVLIMSIWQWWWLCSKPYCM